MQLSQWTYGDRTFKVNDRVKAYYMGRWYKGTIISFKHRRDNYPKELCTEEILEMCGYIFVEEIQEERGSRIIFDDPKHAHTLIQTDGPVENSEGLLNGFGLRSSVAGKDLIFEHEDEYEPPPTFIISDSDEQIDLPF